MQNSFSIERAQSYWRFVPSGEGKHNTVELAQLPDRELEPLWDRAFASRFLRYPEEDSFMQVMAESFHGKQILSIGSGMGFHEIYYQKHGAHITCCDIVPSNLEVIRRISKIKGLSAIKTIPSDNSAQETFNGPFDVAFVYGSLMAMPADDQRRLLAQVKKALRPSGRIVLMLYTWDFAKSTCGWDSTADFDPLVFARASDPSVAEEHCPWSDWHDDAKLLDLAGPDMRITHRQLWQQGLFVWYGLEFGTASDDPLSFFDRAKFLEGMPVAELRPDSFEPVASRIATVGHGLLVETGTDPFAYAVKSSMCEPVKSFNAVRADISLFDGGVSLGVLDVASQSFLNTACVTVQGRQSIVMPVPVNLSNFQMILSNHRLAGPGSSSFVLHRMELINRPSCSGGL
jgi:SAM-dependent methyltransferase